MKTYSVSDFEAALANGAYAWPGGYPIYFVCADGEALSFEAAQKNAELVKAAIAEQDKGGWHVIGAEVNWEDASLYCAHTSKRIESAYAEDEAKS